MKKWLYLGGAILTEVTGSLSLKGALEHRALYAVVVVGFGCAFVCLSRTLKHGMPLGVTYGIWGATGVALTAALSALLFDEALTPMMLAGIALIIAGVLVIEFGSQRAQQEQAATVSGQR